MKPWNVLADVTKVTLVMIVAITRPTTAYAQSFIVDISADSTVTVFLGAPGSYAIQPVGQDEAGEFNAWSPWANTTCTDSTGCGCTSPTTFSGWKNEYLVISEAISAVFVNGEELLPQDTLPECESGFQMTPEVIQFIVSDGFVYPTDLDALSNALSSVFVLSTPSLVEFSHTDFGSLFDNRGGLSLRITFDPLIFADGFESGDTSMWST